MHDNARLHTDNVISDLQVEVLAHPLYSPDLASSNHHLFTKLKEHLAGKSFDDDEKVQGVVREQTSDF